mmetsp:Transcript_10552/g.34849  ORF Transcript_10552/g.34849 Transcript_10552/m.34849 type:complete len:236 (-) Transcript_10552:151-858(-)
MVVPFFALLAFWACSAPVARALLGGGTLPAVRASSNKGLRSEAAEEAEAPSVTAQSISALTSEVSTVFPLEEVQKILPHRYPFALVDKVVAYEAGKRAVGVKSVTFNEPQFTGHFPDRPIMPGVLQIEALAQLAGVVCLQMEGAEPGAVRPLYCPSDALLTKTNSNALFPSQVFFFAGVDGVKWKRPVVPGDTLVMEVEIKAWKAKFGIAKASGRAYVDGNLAVEVKEMTFALAK